MKEASISVNIKQIKCVVYYLKGRFASWDRVVMKDEHITVIHALTIVYSSKIFVI